MALGNIAHGLLIHLSINHSQQVWKSFNGYIRTIRKDVEPSVAVTSKALTAKFLGAPSNPFAWQKIIVENMTLYQSKEILKTG